MKCKKCGTEFYEGIFCPECGTKAEIQENINTQRNSKKVKKPIMLIAGALLALAVIAGGIGIFRSSRLNESPVTTTASAQETPAVTMDDNTAVQSESKTEGADTHNEEENTETSAMGTEGDIFDFAGGWEGKSGRWGFTLSALGQDAVLIDFEESLTASSYRTMKASGKLEDGRIIYSDAQTSVYDTMGGDEYILTENYINGYGTMELKDSSFDPDSVNVSVLAPSGEDFESASKYLVWDHSDGDSTIAQAADSDYSSVNDNVVPTGDEIRQMVQDGKESPDGYIFPDADKEYLSESMLQYFSDEDLRLGVNEIYARHGRAFQTEDLNIYFSRKNWYRGTIPAESFSESVFNSYEKSNIDLIARIREERGNR